MKFHQKDCCCCDRPPKDHSRFGRPPKERPRFDRPLTLEEEIALGDKVGDRNWFDLNRLRHKEMDKSEPAGCVALEMHLLKDERVDSIEDWTPENADEPFGGPAGSW